MGTVGRALFRAIAPAEAEGEGAWPSFSSTTAALTDEPAIFTSAHSDGDLALSSPAMALRLQVGNSVLPPAVACILDNLPRRRGLRRDRPPAMEAASALTRGGAIDL